MNSSSSSSKINKSSKNLHKTRGLKIIQLEILNMKSLPLPNPSLNRTLRNVRSFSSKKKLNLKLT